LDFNLDGARLERLRRSRSAERISGEFGRRLRCSWPVVAYHP